MTHLFLNARRRPQLWAYPKDREFHETTNQPPLPDAGAHIWLCPLQADAWLSGLLSDDEVERAENLFPRSKIPEFILTRGWLRTLLAGYTGAADPRTIRIAIAERGKPCAPDFPEIQFNLSHSGAWAAIAFCASHPVGVDLEKIRPIPDWREIADMVFTKNQRAELDAVAGSDQETEFLRQFTAHEARVKAKTDGTAERKIILTQLPEIPGYIGHLCLAEVTQHT